MAWSVLPWGSRSVEAHIDARVDVAAEGFAIHASTGGTRNVAAETFTTQHVMNGLALSECGPRLMSPRTSGPADLDLVVDF